MKRLFVPVFFAWPFFSAQRQKTLETRGVSTMVKTLCLAVSVVLYMHVRTLGVNEPAKKSLSERQGEIVKVATAKEADMMAILRGLSKEHSDTQAILIQQLRSSPSKERKIAAAYLLGRYRMQDAVPYLAKEIALEAKIVPTDKVGLWDAYPAVEALVKIGNPAIPAMIANIEATDDKTVRELSARVIRHVETPRVARFVIELAIEKQQDPGKKKNLHDALQYLGDK
jgi:HEAT repeat protein